jgi:nitrite reductase (NADH) small subunit
MLLVKRGNSYVVGAVEDIPPGSSTIVPVGKFGIGVFNVGGTFRAVTNYCPHRGAPLCLGSVTGIAEPTDTPYGTRWVREGEILRCPWHGWEFDLDSGKACAYPNKSIRTYPVRVIDGSIVVEGI